MYKRNQSVTTE